MEYGGINSKVGKRSSSSPNSIPKLRGRQSIRSAYIPTFPSAPLRREQQQGVMKYVSEGCIIPAAVAAMEEDSGDGTDFDSWAESITKKLPNFITPPSTIVPIPRVPDRLRQGNNQAYEPEIIALGPYHRRSPRLRHMEKYKWRYLLAILSRNQDISLQDYLRMVKNQEKALRSCYADSFDIGSEEFVEAMLLDGCFAVEYIIRVHERVTDDLDCMVWAEGLVARDMVMLLENQLPFFLLHSIFNLATSPSSSMDFTSLAINYLCWISDKKHTFPCATPQPIHHLLHLYHSFCLRSPAPGSEDPSGAIKIEGWEEKKPEDAPYSMTPNATRLKEAGVVFVRRPDHMAAALDVSFEGGALTMPPIVIAGPAKSQLLNFIAFEQFYPSFYRKFHRSFSAYADFVNDIVRTPEDVGLLREEGIIHYDLGGDRDVAEFFKNMNRGIFVKSGNYLNHLDRKIDEYMRGSWRRCRARLMRDYFGRPWSGILATTGAVILLLLLLQTGFAGSASFRSPAWPSPTPP